MTWELCNTRRLSVQGASAWHFGIGECFADRYKTGIFSTLAYYDGKKTEFHFDKEDHIEFNKVLDSSLEEHEFLWAMIPEANVFLQEKHDEIEYLLRGAYNLQGRSLADLFESFIEHYNEFYTRKWMAYRISGRIVKKMQEKISDEMVQVFSTPLVPNDVINERIDLLKIALHGGDLKEHIRKYRHIPMFDLDHDPYEDEHFKHSLDDIENPEKELNDIHEEYKERVETFEKAMDKVRSGPSLRKLIMMMKRAAIFRDHGDTVRQRVNLLAIPLYDRIGEELGLSRKEVCLLTNDEILHLLRHGKKFDRQEMEKRKKAFLLMQYEGQTEIYSGSEAIEKGKSLHEASDGEIKGITAVAGKVRGSVRIIHTNLEFNKFEEGDVLVTTMTRQDFVPLMRKASAIVTDEGSIISHAAVIARELGVPCIVGTRNATHTLKDGEKVEVNADEGVVKIITS